MLLLTSTSDIISIVTGSAGAIDVHASFIDYSGTNAPTPGRTNTPQITTATTTTVVASPAAAIQRNVRSLNIRNASVTVANQVTVRHFDGTTTTTLFQYTMQVGEQIQYYDEGGWIVIDVNGNRKTTFSLSSGLKQQIFTGNGTFTIPSGITQVKVTVVGGGGGGGGALTGGTSAQEVGGGGGGAGCAIKWLTGLTPGNTLTVTVGPGGAGGAAGANNGVAGNQSAVASGTQTIATISGNGGGGGVNGNNPAAAGGAASGGDLNFTGSAAMVFPTLNAGASGNGLPSGTSIFAGVGTTSGAAGGNGGAPGAGGSGAGAGGGSSAAGGNGAAGVVIFEWIG